MVIKKGIRYGRTTKEVIEFGFPKDNTGNIKVDNEMVLTDDEVREMFPNQFVVLKAVEFDDIYDLVNFKKAIVKYCKCEGYFARKMVKELSIKDSEGVYFSTTYYDPVLEGDLLWF